MNTIVRVKDKTKDFTIMLNEAFRRDDLTARAKGLYAYLMTLPDDWKITQPELFSHFPEGRDAMRNAFDELVDAGYIVGSQAADGTTGKFQTFKWTVFESSKLADNRSLENRSTGNQRAVKRPERKPRAGKPLTGKPASGVKSEKKPVAGKPLSGKPVAGKPLSGKSAPLLSTKRRSTEDQEDKSIGAPSETPATVALVPVTETKAEKAMPISDSPMYHAIWDPMLEEYGTIFPNPAREGKAVKQIMDMIRRMKKPEADEVVAATAIVEAFRKKLNSNDRMWRDRTFTPSELSSDWTFKQVVEYLRHGGGPRPIKPTTADKAVGEVDPEFVMPNFRRRTG